MEKDFTTFINTYRAYACKYIQYFNEGDKKLERDIKNLSKLNSYMRKNIDFAKRVIDKLILDDDTGTRGIISIMALEFDYNTKMAINNIEKIINDKSNGYFSVYVQTHLTKYYNKKMKEGEKN